MFGGLHASPTERLSLQFLPENPKITPMQILLLRTSRFISQPTFVVYPYNLVKIIKFNFDIM
jgi:hypothetical protein